MHIDNGGIMESGTHDELMAKKGYYDKLYTAQLDEVQSGLTPFQDIKGFCRRMKTG